MISLPCRTAEWSSGQMRGIGPEIAGCRSFWRGSSTAQWKIICTASWEDGAEYWFKLLACFIFCVCEHRSKETCHHELIPLGFQLSPDLETFLPFWFLLFFLCRCFGFFRLLFLLGLGFLLCFLSSFDTDQTQQGLLINVNILSTPVSNHDAISM